MEERTLPRYEAPVIITYTNEEILEELGPARTQLSGAGGGNYLGG
jgi:hypothetical protein